MGFKFNATTTTRSSGGSQKEIDWDAMNAHVIEKAGTASKARSIPGVISGIIDLGEQERGDFEEEFKGTPTELEKKLAEREGSYTKEVGGKTFFCSPQKPVQQVAVTVDFPQIMVDKGQFFGTSNPQPLRLMLNGEFFTKEDGRIVAKPYNISDTKHDDGTWAFAKNNGLHKLAAAVECLTEDGYFHKEDLGDLLGKVALFQFRVYMKPSKQDKSKTFFTEEIKLAGMVPEGIPIPEFDESILYGVNLFGENDPEAVKQLRQSVKNTIKRALNYADSDLKVQLEAAEKAGASKPKADAKPKADKPADEAPDEDTGPSADDFDEDIPFAPIGLQEGRLFLHMI